MNEELLNSINEEALCRESVLTLFHAKWRLQEQLNATEDHEAAYAYIVAIGRIKAAIAQLMNTYDPIYDNLQALIFAATQSQES